ncbi:tRNA (adenine(58)-N(1))-methyltransferase catalytic subunit trm61 [Penicillium macrosclerotiorum]|uniref:tRNA (adenine(58)-N(1))-methyltransferase catalytic subunit trm61 n=1 Tax=Penicillium macrosclerotiorum TaxID=303699 RepID=UPI002547EAC3|nr:tRNA (adenine(58)-N(1))-methyltransferase catalytic subunit trm61 [Penicillium macrosclerotiorum]KAJ5689387.1 tRNA (adenine(58)-N(1))-methyltransferase catalytic subunit trm61 [Penicillium macrosclerotiorum]
MPSPFLTPGSTAKADDFALLHIRRDQTIPTILRSFDDENQGYKEGKVSNTRFGSFPHSTLIDQPWGSQIPASKVDTGSRGRQGRGKKRKAEDLDASGTTTGADEDKASPQKAVAAGSGFIHMMSPTPESWTLSLPHRTQVVYMSDYSYVLHRLRARPGGTIIEAGAGSGSFTHAAVRAVFSGYPTEEPTSKKRRLGKVCSFEFHEQRVGRVKEEITEHGLDGLVEVTHRDVYEDGFLLGDPKTGRSPKANAIFLDLPAPWLALKHLVRKPASGAESPLDPSSPVFLCTFSPCLEQVQRTIRTMRQLGWLDISMVEVSYNRIEVKRERIGLDAEGVRGATVFPKSVDEAVAKLRVEDERAKRNRQARIDGTLNNPSLKEENSKSYNTWQSNSVPEYQLGRVVHRSEPEIKTHTSYLVFAILPRDWSEEDEQKCRQMWVPNKVDGEQKKPEKSKKQMKKEYKAQRLQEKAAKEESGEPAEEPTTEA